MNVGAWAGEGSALLRPDTDAAEERAAAPTGDSIDAAAPRLHPRADRMHAPDRPAPTQRIAPSVATPTAAVVSVERREERPAAIAIRVDASLGSVPVSVPLAVPRPPHAALPGSIDAPARVSPGHEESGAGHVERQERTSRVSPLGDAPARVSRAAPIAEVVHARASRVSPETRTPSAPVAPRAVPVTIASAERPPAPTIHVSIGRIEVRAVPAPPPARAQRTDQQVPRLTLDAYLRSRASEGA